MYIFSRIIKGSGIEIWTRIKSQKYLHNLIMKMKKESFLDTHDSTEYFDLSHPIKLDVSALKPTTRPITVRLPLGLVIDLKRLANDVTYT